MLFLAAPDLARTSGQSVPRERVAACLIVQDEQERLPAALASVAFCDEVIVVDGGSTDRTVEIARSAGATVIENRWPGYAIQRNVALDAATSQWVVEVDADERVSERLRASVEELLTAPPPGVGIAVCPLRHRFLGRLLGPSAKYPAYRSRIFRREVYRHDERREVHEGVEPRERPVVLEGDLEHELAGSPREALRDMWSYARLESRHVAPPTARGYATGIVLRPAAKIVYRTIVDGGWRDGWRGLLKISLDAGSDAFVWMLVLLSRLGGDDGAGANSGDDGAGANSGDDGAGANSRSGGAQADGEGVRPEHFGRRRVGPTKVLALAARGRSTRTAAEWLAGLRAQGADVVLVAEHAGCAEDVPLRAVARFRPLQIMRAIDLEMQVRELDAVVAFGRRARLVWRLLPRTLRPQVPGLDANVDPGRAELRSSG